MNIDYRKTCSNLLTSLPQKTSDVIERRFGLKKENKETLESIGQSYGITRERVRQIENEGLSKIDTNNDNCKNIFKVFKKEFEFSGGVKEESSLCSSVVEDKLKNHVLFLLSLGKFERYSEDINFNIFWSTDKESELLAKKTVNVALTYLKKDKKPLLIGDLLNLGIFEKSVNKNILSSYLGISKKIQKNFEDQFGLSQWVEINPKGIKNKAYLVLKKQGKPVHFRQVAQLIKDSPYFTKDNIHTATVHNELIKDSRFVLVGRGLYGLQEWGYEPGIVKDIIKKVIKDSGKALTRREVLSEVLKQREVKENTVFLNLQNKSHFLKDSDEKYTVKES